MSAASVTSLVDALLPDLVAKRGTMLFYALSDTQGAILVGRFSVGTPVRESRSAIAAFEKERLAEGRRTFLLLRDQMFAQPPRSTPLALALTVMANNAPKQGTVRYYLATDAREFSAGIDMECHPPTAEAWAAHLQHLGYLPPDSLHGTTVTFVGVRPMMLVPGNRCQPTLALMNATKDLWDAAISNAGGTAVFARDHDDLPSAAVLFFFGNSLLWWRKQRVKLRARKDLQRVRYAAKPIIIELIGPKPWLDPDDPEHENALRRLDVLRPLIDELKNRLRDVREQLAHFVRWSYLASGATAGLITEGTAWTIILRDAGTPNPERYLMGAMLGAFFIILVAIAAKHAETTGSRKWLVTSIVIIGIIAVAATYVRVNNALATGASVSEELALGILLLCAALGPAIAVEYLLRPMRPMIHLVRLRNELKKQLREATREFENVTRRLSGEARLRRAWQWEYDTLEATYDGINPPPHQDRDIVHSTSGVPLHPASGPVNGIPLSGGTVWTDSGSSSTLRPS